MTKETAQLCLWASALYENERLSRDEIYFYLINTRSRVKEVSNTRQLVGYVLYNHFDYTMQMIAEEFKLINHSTIVYWMDRVQQEIKTNRRMKYRYEYLKDCLQGEVKEIKKMITAYQSNRILSDADKDFIKFNLDKGFSVSYISDALKKTRGAVKEYIALLNRKNPKLEAKAMSRVRVHSFNKRQPIDY